ncbi:phospholipase D family protein [Micromonospora sp. NBC_01699]|uniref:phospholipase D family protein n=1 Tax=Micromonospora sp. NBC_01699 TaxID=2975984 RepID=UPI002E34326C|nr:phospholipase D family protein [Micromonospora sp. NBC_01699]
MLQPDSRRTLVDSLRPPPGTRLDWAVGTTYSLNLTTLLVVPAATAHSAGGGWGDDDDDEPDGFTPVGLLDALNRAADRITVFCDAGQIAPPLHRRRVLLGFVEQAVVPVTAPEGGVFHPKLWALRYVDAAGGPTYRVLVATRNLTFDRCWDTITVLESDPDGQPLPGIGNVVRALPDLSVSPLSSARRDRIGGFGDELDTVPFASPAGFGDLRLHAFGLGGGSWPFPKTCHRLLVLSPFLTAHTLKRLPQASIRRSVVSRPDALAAVGQAGESYDRFTLNPAVLDDVGDLSGASRDDPRRVDNGLHAKLYVTDDETGTSWWTGSANATSAAFERNVEVLLQLRTTNERHSASALLRERKEGDPEARTLRDLLVPWEDDGTEPEEPVDDNQDELDRLRRLVAAVAFSATVVESEPGRYGVTYRSDEALPVPEDVGLRCWPATVGQPDRPAALDSDGRLGYETSATLTTLSAFLVIELTLAKLSTAFVVRCAMHGEPDNRRQLLVAELLGDEHRLVRYLVALLSDDDAPLDGDGTNGAGVDIWSGGDLERLPLTELMIRALARDSGRLRQIADLLSTVRHGGGRLPEGLDDLWDAVWQIAREDVRG